MPLNDAAPALPTTPSAPSAADRPPASPTAIDKSPKKLRSLSGLLPFLRPYRLQIGLALLFLLLAAGATLVIPTALRQVIDAGFNAPDLAARQLAIRHEFFGLFGVAVALGLFTAARFYMVSWIGERVTADVRSAVYAHVLRQSPQFFETTQTGEVLSRLTTDTTLVQTVVGSSLSMGLRNTVLFLGGLVMLLITNPYVMGTVMGVIVVVVVPAVVVGRRVRKLSRSSQDRVADASAIAAEVLNAIPVVQGYTQEPREAQRFADASENAFRTAVRRNRTRALLTAFIIIAMFGSLLWGVYQGVQAVMRGDISAGHLGQTVLYIMLVASSVAVLAEVWGDMLRAAGATERLMELLAARSAIEQPRHAMPVDLPHFEREALPRPHPPLQEEREQDILRVQDVREQVRARGQGETEQELTREHVQKAQAAGVEAPPLSSQSPRSVGARICFDRVSFYYPSRPLRPALDDVSFTLEPGENVALVGPSGAGKSTVIQLLLRFYDASAGSVQFNGVPLKQADLHSLRGSIALVPQESTIFSASAMDNIRYGRPDASDAEVQAAAQAAHADEFIRALPEGYASFLGERGVRLSGGQKQRMAIARAMLKNAPLLLLDEATSALDAESERAVQQALEVAMRGRTTLVIAHRLATVQAADRILVLDHGRLVEQGTHAQLVAQGGLYSRLAALQFNT